MKSTYQLFIFLLGLVSLTSCRKEKAEDLIEINTNFNKLDENKFHFNDTIDFNVTSKYKIDSIHIENEGDFQYKKPFIVNNTFHLGINTIKMSVFYEGKSKQYESNIVIYSSKKPENIEYDIIKKYPHDSSLFTQGFLYNDGIIYESAGGFGKSRVVKYKLGTKDYINSLKVNDQFFAEGLTRQNDSLFQLTWKNRKLFIYDSNLNYLHEYNYPHGLNEGWGITQNLDDEFIVSDGTSVLKYISKHDFSTISREKYIVDDNNFYSKINEIEYKDGYIYANIWGKTYLVVIDEKSGEVVGKIDFEDIVKLEQTNNEAVLNGIAFKGSNLLITGKNWSKIYEIKMK